MTTVKFSVILFLSLQWFHHQLCRLLTAVTVPQATNPVLSHMGVHLKYLPAGVSELHQGLNS